MIYAVCRAAVSQQAFDVDTEGRVSGERRIAGASVACGFCADAGEERRARSAASDPLPDGQRPGTVPQDAAGTGQSGSTSPQRLHLVRRPLVTGPDSILHLLPSKIKRFPLHLWGVGMRSGGVGPEEALQLTDRFGFSIS